MRLCSSASVGMVAQLRQDDADLIVIELACLPIVIEELVSIVVHLGVIVLNGELHGCFGCLVANDGPIGANDVDSGSICIMNPIDLIGQLLGGLRRRHRSR